MIDFVVTFIAMFLVDIIFAYYLKAVNTDKAVKAGLWAAMVTFVNIVAVISYTENHLMVIPAVLGAFAGTFVGIKFQTVDSR
jgi:xanthine/uracil permease